MGCVLAVCECVLAVCECVLAVCECMLAECECVLYGVSYLDEELSTSSCKCVIAESE